MHAQAQSLGFALRFQCRECGQTANLDANEVQGQGFRGEPESILEKTSTLLIGFESIRPGNGLVEMDRIYHVNPKSEQAIKKRSFSHEERIRVTGDGNGARIRATSELVL